MAATVRSSLGDYTVLQTLHKGPNATLKVATNSVSPNTLQLLKVFSTAPPSLPKPMTHEHIVQVYAPARTDTYVSKKGDQREVTYIAEELCRRGGVFDYIAFAGAISEPALRTVFTQVVYALEFAHQQGIAHGALKPENLLFASDYTVKVSDFGLGKRPDWSPFDAPEVLQGVCSDLHSADVFSLGVLLYSLQFGYLPFEQAVQSDPQYRLFQTNKSFFWQQRKGRLISPNPSHHFIGLVDWMCAPDPTQRPSLAEVRLHGWLHGPMPDITVLRGQIARQMKDYEDERTRKRSYHQRKKAVQSAGSSFRGLDWEGDTEETRSTSSFQPFRASYFRLYSLFTPDQAAYLVRSLLRNREGYTLSEHPRRLHFLVRFESGKQTEVRLEVRLDSEGVVVEMKKTQGNFFVFARLFNLVKAEFDYSESLFSLCS